MRAVVALLLVAVLAVLANLTAAIVSPGYRQALSGWKPKVGISSAGVVPAAPSAGTASPDEMSKISDSLEKMAIGLDALSETGAATLSGSGKTAPATASGAAVPPPAPDVEIPGGLLARLMPDVFPKKIENAGIFDIHVFSGINYTTYADTKAKVKLYAFAEPYSVMRSNLKLVPEVYSINETDTFFDASFFLNPTNKKDDTIRFVASADGGTVGFEVPKSAYAKLRKLLSKK